MDTYPRHSPGDAADSGLLPWHQAAPVSRAVVVLGGIVGWPDSVTADIPGRGSLSAARRAGVAWSFVSRSPSSVPRRAASHRYASGRRWSAAHGLGPLAADQHLPRGRVELDLPDLDPGRLDGRRPPPQHGVIAGWLASQCRNQSARTFLSDLAAVVSASCFVHKTALHAGFISATYCSPYSQLRSIGDDRLGVNGDSEPEVG